MGVCGELCSKCLEAQLFCVPWVYPWRKGRRKTRPPKLHDKTKLIKKQEEEEAAVYKTNKLSHWHFWYPPHAVLETSLQTVTTPPMANVGFATKQINLVFLRHWVIFLSVTRCLCTVSKQSLLFLINDKEMPTQNRRRHFKVFPQLDIALDIPLPLNF